MGGRLQAVRETHEDHMLLGRGTAYEHEEMVLMISHRSALSKAESDQEDLNWR